MWVSRGEGQETALSFGVTLALKLVIIVVGMEGLRKVDKFSLYRIDEFILFVNHICFFFIKIPIETKLYVKLPCQYVCTVKQYICTVKQLN